jgi:hypothetical protein
MHTERTIRNCTVRIDTPCPKRWDDLQPTAAAAVRHCAVCARDVFLCSSAEETLEHARAGHCIAREEPHPSELPRMVLGLPTVVPVVTNEQERAQAWARRERGINTLLRGRLEAASRPCPDCGYPVPDFRKSCYVCGLEIGRG